MSSSGKRPALDRNSEEAGPSAKRRAPIKNRVLKLYGKNDISNNKLRAVDSFSKGKDFGAICRELRVQRATAEVYTIDAFCWEEYRS
ncbi:unnamed protein product [Porites evermanni]|uniref:Uncharacterized protein n=1 Tax=Porites evermanni TaxID=104178 RepID=A0ABN8M6Q7_9CNID|nr:unnamed protein product [Porites evermanni]